MQIIQFDALELALLAAGTVMAGAASYLDSLARNK
jgi:hypothetical protein